jgi:hypothetical protein
LQLGFRTDPVFGIVKSLFL